MGKKTKIGWTHHTFNPWWGCVEDGDECDNCYARELAKRWGYDVWGIGDRRFFNSEKGVHWKEPLLWDRDARDANERRRVFCGSMCDWAERRSDEVGRQMTLDRFALYELIDRTKSLDWLLLTKRPQNIRAIAPVGWGASAPGNVWLGTTAGTRAGWEKRVKYLRQHGGPVRFVSCEPMLEHVGAVNLDGIDWVICGGESEGGRHFELDWARYLRDRCAQQGVAFFFKQLGTNCTDGGRPLKVKRADIDDLALIPEDLRIREYPTVSP